MVLKEFLRLDYRKLSALLNDAPGLAAVIELKHVPHFSTFQKAAARLIDSNQQTISQLESADYEGHSLTMLRRIADALEQELVVQFVPARAG